MFPCILLTTLLSLEDLVYDLRVWFSTCNEPDVPFQMLVDVFSNEGVGAQSVK